jgi:PAS domain S-box-containing protein
VAQLSTENDALKQVLTQRISNKMRIAQLESVPTCSDLPNIDVAPSGLSVISHNPEVATSILAKSDFSLMKAIQAAQRSFVITDPSLPDNPIIFASKGFLDMCGYRLEEVLGRNCRFLQGPDTDPEQIQTLRNGVIKGDDTSVCLLNYKADGTRFYNQIFVAALRDANNVVINYVGVQVEVMHCFVMYI